MFALLPSHFNNLFVNRSHAVYVALIYEISISVRINICIAPSKSVLSYSIQLYSALCISILFNSVVLKMHFYSVLFYSVPFCSIHHLMSCGYVE